MQATHLNCDVCACRDDGVVWDAIGHHAWYVVSCGCASVGRAALCGLRRWLATVDVTKQITPPADEILIGELPAVGINLAEPLQVCKCKLAWFDLR